MTLISFVEVCKSFGGHLVFGPATGIIRRGERVGVVGPNGAGKTTFFNLLTGFHKPDEGTILYKGQDITGIAPDRIMRYGISRSFQVVSLFEEMTVLDNVRIGVQSKLGFKGRLFLNFETNRRIKEKALAILERVRLVDIKDQLVTAISHGDRKILDLAMSLTMDPDVLLLDEPMSGLAKGERVRIIELITEDFRKDMKLIIVEHDMDAVFTLSDKILVLNQGAVLALGTPGEISNNQHVQKAYLGERSHAAA
ncbi:MAG: ABC transporter ATP-binding protein [Candidatus Glassbacteria bacterium]|nr:ABC transporter ATP-binding protein [Candidatus Glassbacteria bacterium]